MAASLEQPARAGAQRFVQNRDVSCRMFRRDWLESLSRVHPVVPHLVYVPLIAVLLWTAIRRNESAAHLTGLFGAGVVLWTLAEYVIHRFVFHPPQHIEDDTRRILREMPDGAAAMPLLPTVRHRFYFLVHGVHHDFPSDSRRLVMPPSVSLPLAIVFFGIFHAALGQHAPAAFAGFVAGYLWYDTAHYFTHHGTRRRALGRVLRKWHFQHHYVDSSRNYGVSSPLWDLVFGTRGRAA